MRPWAPSRPPLAAAEAGRSTAASCSRRTRSPDGTPCRRSSQLLAAVRWGSAPGPGRGRRPCTTWPARCTATPRTSPASSTASRTAGRSSAASTLATAASSDRALTEEGAALREPPAVRLSEPPEPPPSCRRGPARPARPHAARAARLIRVVRRRTSTARRPGRSAPTTTSSKGGGPRRGAGRSPGARPGPGSEERNWTRRPRRKGRLAGRGRRPRGAGPDVADRRSRGTRTRRCSAPRSAGAGELDGQGLLVEANCWGMPRCRRPGAAASGAGQPPHRRRSLPGWARPACVKPRRALRATSGSARAGPDVLGGGPDEAAPGASAPGRAPTIRRTASRRTSA